MRKRAGAAPQEAPICLQCIERAEQEIAAGHYYRADELMAALRERREPVCACGETHRRRSPKSEGETMDADEMWFHWSSGHESAALLGLRTASDDEAHRFLDMLARWQKCPKPSDHAARHAPETREPELLGYVVERQLTTGEWMRVWRGRTMWFDHDEAVLDRDAYALDGIPARIRPVYLGAPAPQEATEARDAMDFCPTCKHPRWTTACQCAPAPEPSGAEAAVREAYAVIDELAPQWSGSSIATVLRAFITVVDDMAQRVQRIDSGPWRRP